jgi:hypothetical protein
MTRSDNLGVASVMRSILIHPSLYIPMLGFFRSTAWTLDGLMQTWWYLVQKNAPIMKNGDYTVIIGDGMKQMPGVKLHHQESGNSGKPSYIWGHMFGAIGVLTSKGAKYFCIPLALTLQDGVRTIFGWGGGTERQNSHVVELVNLACKVTSAFGKTILLLDSLYLSVPALKKLDEYNSSGERIHIVSRAKNNCVAYNTPEPKPPGRRGRPAKRGSTVKLSNMFNTENFVETNVELYGKTEHISYYYIDLLWGLKLYRKLRFVLVKRDDSHTILAGTDATLDPVNIIELYVMRFKVESMFREMKQAVSSFCYRFWAKRMGACYNFGQDVKIINE